MTIVNQTFEQRKQILRRIGRELDDKPLWSDADFRQRDQIENEVTKLRREQREQAQREYYSDWIDVMRNGLHLTPHQRGVSPEVQQRFQAMQRRDVVGGGGMVGQGQAAYPGATAAYFVPVGFEEDVSSALKFYAAMVRSGTTLETTTGAPLPWPTVDDTSVSGELIGESLTLTEQVVTNISAVMFGAFKYSSKIVKLSLELLRDSGFPLGEFLAQAFAIRIGRILNAHLTTGVGGTQPTGIVTAASASPAIAAIGSNSNDGLSGSNAGNSIGSDDLSNLESALDPAYRENGSFMMHPDTLSVLRKAKNKQGTPLFVGLHSGGSNTLLNYPVLLNPAMDAIPTTPSSPQKVAKTVLFGDLSKYVIRRGPLAALRLEERYCEYGQVAFIALARYDGNLLNADAAAPPVRVLTNSY